MRTTVTLDPDVASKLKALAHKNQASFKTTLNDVIRRGLSAQRSGARRQKKFVVKPHAAGFLPGVDLGKLNQLTDDLEVEEFGRVSGAGE